MTVRSMKKRKLYFRLLLLLDFITFLIASNYSNMYLYEASNLSTEVQFLEIKVIVSLVAFIASVFYTLKFLNNN